MSEHELQRVEVLAQIVHGRVSVQSGADVLGLTRRHVVRLLKRYRAEGAPGLTHRARGRHTSNHFLTASRDHVLSLIQENYADLGPTLVSERLQEQHGLQVSRETIRNWMIKDGLWLSRKKRQTVPQPRRRRDCLGELIRIEGAEHRWFDDRGDPCTLIVFIDDATSALMELRFVTSGSTFGHFEALERYLLKHGRPVAFDSDMHTVFRAPRPDEPWIGMTRLRRGLAELDIEMSCADTSNAKDRVEHVEHSLLDPLVAELRRAGVCDMGAANAYLPGFRERHNATFAKVPARPDNLHRPLNIAPGRLSEVFCLRDTRYVSKDLTLRYDHKRIQLEGNDLTRGLVSKFVDIHEFADGRIEVRYEGLALPCTIFDPHQQRVTRAAISDNRHLSAVLAHIKKQQDNAAATPLAKPGSTRNGSRKTGWTTNEKAPKSRAAGPGSES